MFCAGTAGQDQHRDGNRTQRSSGQDFEAHSGFGAVQSAPTREEETRGGEAGRTGHLETSDNTSHGSNDTTLSDLCHDAPWIPANSHPLTQDPEPEVINGDPLTRAEWDAFREYHSIEYK